MGRSSCPSCGANVDIARDVKTDQPVVLEVHTDASSEAPRYRIVGDLPLVVERVPDGYPGDYFPDHKYDCPAFNAGREIG